ncbi:hypothetical protein AN964_08120 [Heyndrickxia shackletonii]|uniref:DUF1510 domain-containing protein n=1 Tax=Heyndrickxia shackletonii TaxID=157838 RepID=A0A0Q3WWS0_9BACI|nr:YrrS family protein [Heyndrickxia shackletonii]KQL53463.1 hypothetical protein AN964_08120 [Heyndrickxia shackletonii]NEZ00039.1 DUF1510 family protein [Heyndrickxia shackletonii]
MANDYNHPNRSRSLQRAKRRKTNIILNSLIVIVILLIVIVACTIFLGGGKNDNKNTAPANTTHTQDKTKNTSKNEKDNQNNGNNDNSTGTVNDNNDQSGNATDDNQSDNSSTNENGDTSLNNSDVVANEGNDGNVKKTYVNPNWKPVGTSQTGGHQYSSDSNSTDWKEKEKALSYATGIPTDQITIWYMSRSGSDSSVIGTITSKKNKKAYRVYLEWVDGQGWKPSKVEELEHNDRQ